MKCVWLNSMYSTQLFLCIRTHAFDIKIKQNYTTLNLNDMLKYQILLIIYHSPHPHTHKTGDHYFLF